MTYQPSITVIAHKQGSIIPYHTILFGGNVCMIDVPQHELEAELDAIDELFGTEWFESARLVFDST